MTSDGSAMWQHSDQGQEKIKSGKTLMDLDSAMNAKFDDRLVCLVDFEIGIWTTFRRLGGDLENKEKIGGFKFEFDKNFAHRIKCKDFNYYVKLYHELQNTIDATLNKYYGYDYVKTVPSGTGNAKNNSNYNENNKKSENSNTSNNDKQNERKKNNGSNDANDKTEGENQFVTTPLSEIMSLRGMCSCSGHCGNSIIKFSLLFYKSVLDQVLSLKYFNKNATKENTNAFWDQLLNNLIFNDDKNLNVNTMYAKCSVNDKVEWFKDMLCLMYQIFDKVGYHPLFDPLHRSKFHKNNNKNQWQEKLDAIVKDSKSNERLERVKHMVETMLDSFKDIYNQCKDNNGINIGNESWHNFMFNGLLKAIMIHNYCSDDDSPKQIFMEEQLSRQMMSNMKTNNLNESNWQQMRHNSPYATIKNDIWDRMDKQFLSQLISNEDCGEDLSLMRLLVISVNFIIESDSTLKKKMKCYIRDGKDNLIEEMKRNGIYKTYLANVKQIPKKSIHNKYDLNASQSACLYLWTNTNTCTQIKSAHRRGETCHYRHFCQCVREGLIKLRQHEDKTSNVNELTNVYGGISCVTFDIENNRAQDIMSKIVEKINMTSSIDDCMCFDTFTSSSRDPEIALKFSQMSVDSGGIVFVIDFTRMWNNPDIIFGDISSFFKVPSEGDIAIGPCMVKIDQEMDENEWPNFSGKIGNQTKVFKVELRKLSNVSLLMKRLKKRLKNISNNNDYHADDDNASMMKQWISNLFNKSSKNKKKEIFDKLRQCYATLEMIYDRVTDERLQEKAKILHCKDRQVLISGVYDYYCRDNHNNCNPAQMIVHNVLTKLFDANTWKLKKYFVAFMNVYHKCDLKTIQQVTPDIIKQDLAMNESIIKRKSLIEKILPEIQKISDNVNLHLPSEMEDSASILEELSLSLNLYYIFFFFCSF